MDAATLNQAELDGLEVMHHDNRGGTPQQMRAADWLGEPVRLGRRLTEAEAGRLSAYQGFQVNNTLHHDHCGYVLDDATGWTLHVYLEDPLAVVERAR